MPDYHFSNFFVQTQKDRKKMLATTVLYLQLARPFDGFSENIQTSGNAIFFPCYHLEWMQIRQQDSRELVRSPAVLLRFPVRPSYDDTTHLPLYRGIQGC